MLKQTRAILLRRAHWIGCIFPNFGPMCSKTTVYETLPHSIKQLKFEFTASKILFQKAIWKIRLNSTICTDLEIDDAFFQWKAYRTFQNYFFFKIW